MLVALLFTTGAIGSFFGTAWFASVIAKRSPHRDH